MRHQHTPLPCAWCEGRKEDWFCTHLGWRPLRTASALASLLHLLVSTCVPPLLHPRLAAACCCLCARQLSSLSSEEVVTVASLIAARCCRVSQDVSPSCCPSYCRYILVIFFRPSFSLGQLCPAPPPPVPLVPTSSSGRSCSYRPRPDKESICWRPPPLTRRTNCKHTPTALLPALVILAVLCSCSAQQHSTPCPTTLNLTIFHLPPLSSQQVQHPQPSPPSPP